MPREQPPGLAGQDRPAAEPEHAVVAGQGLRHRGPLQRAEGRLAVGDEDVGDRLARPVATMSESVSR